MLTYDLLLDRLTAAGGKPRKTGRRAGQTRAHRLACPVCGGSDKQKLAVWERANGSVGAHCYGCSGNAAAVLRSFGFSIDDMPRPPLETYETTRLADKKTVNTCSSDWLSLAALAEKLADQALDVTVLLHAHTGAAELALQLFDTAAAVARAAREAMRSNAKGGSSWIK